MKKVITIFLIAIVVFVVPMSIYGYDKHDLLSSLISYSYPEVKVIENKEDGQTEEKDIKDDQYINIYVGKENIPTEDTKEVALNTSLYKDDLRITKNNPKILIYHSHSCETYSNSPAGNYHSDDKENSVMSVGALLTNELSNLGWGVVHSTKYHDSPTYNKAYIRSSQTIENAMNTYDSIKLTVDLHRDGLNIYNESTKSNLHDKYTTTIDGKRVAKFFFVVGARNYDLNNVKGLADGITEYAKGKYPDLIMPVVMKPYGRFNQSICENALLVEVGSNATTTSEAQASVKYLAEILDGYFKENNL